MCYRGLYARSRLIHSIVIDKERESVCVDDVRVRIKVNYQEKLLNILQRYAVHQISRR